MMLNKLNSSVSGLNYTAQKREFKKSGYVAKTFGIDPFELGQYAVAKKVIDTLEEGAVVVSGEALQLNSNGKVAPVSDGTAKYVAIQPNDVWFDKTLEDNKGVLLSVVGQESNEVYCLELTTDKRIVLEMLVNEDVAEGDVLNFDTTYGLKKDATNGVFVVVEGGKANSTAKVVRK